MITYEVYCRDILLGILSIREGQHRFDPVPENVRKLENVVPLLVEIARGRDWGKPIPFFYTRIENAKRFGTEALIRSHTDDFIMRRIDT